jgi:hypothetical protein
MLTLKMTDDGLMVVSKGGNLCRFVSKETDNQVLNNARAELEKLISDYSKTLSAYDYAKTLSASGYLQSLPEYVSKGEHILKSEYDRLFKSITHYPVSHNRFYNPKKSKKQKQKEKIDRLEKELKEAREVIYSQALTINRLESKELILIEHKQTTIKDAPESKVNREIKDSAPKHLNIELKRIYDAAVDNSPKGITEHITMLSKDKSSGWRIDEITGNAFFSCACNASPKGKYSQKLTLSDKNMSKVLLPFRK